MPLTIIVACERGWGIGIDNRLPWHLAQDLAYFKRTTSGHAIIMGRKTYDSIGKPLPKRRNIVLTRNPNWQAEGVETAASLGAAQAMVGGDEAFIIGGADVYGLALPLASRILITEIDHDFVCDAFFPMFSGQEWQEMARQPQTDAAFPYAFVEYRRRG
jgi:dihydrofolate reductase